MSDPKRIQKAALSYIKNKGPMDKVSAARMAQAIQSGDIELRNELTIDDAHQIAQLIMAISYTASPQRYDAGNGIADPEAGAQLLSSQALKTAPVMQAIAEIAGENSEYTQAVNVQLAAQNKSEAMQNTAEQNKEFVDEASKSGLELPDTAENTQQTDVQQTTNGAVIYPNEAGGYTRQSAGVFHQDKKANPSCAVTMSSESSGTYRGSKTGTGDSRDSRNSGSGD